MKVVIVKPEVIDIPENGEIPAGIMSVIPAIPWEASLDELQGNELPDFTIELAGQYLSRELYPELQGDYTHTGGLYQFGVPDLSRKFLLGFDENGKAVLGNGIGYFQGYPPLRNFTTNDD